MFKPNLSKKKYIVLNTSNEKTGDAVYPPAKNEERQNRSDYPVGRQQAPIKAGDRIKLIVDEGSFEEFNSDLRSCNPLKFPGYEEKLKQAEQTSGLKEAIITGHASIGGCRVVLAIMDSRFMMGSMGSVVGEKFSRAVERCIEARLPLIVCAASGGARIQEGMLALMQMAKTTAVLNRFRKEGLLYISILTHPTTGGVCASFASLADIIIAEPGALIGFTGPRVIKQTLGQQLPEDFQRAEFLLQHGMVDMICESSKLRETLCTLLRLHQGGSDG